MADSVNHTPLPIPPPTKTDAPIQRDNLNVPVMSTGANKEAGPTLLNRVEGPIDEQTPQTEQSSESNQSKEQKKGFQHKKDVPDIHPDAAQAGLQVSPAASPFPTVYDIKVPVLKDEEIEQNLHKSFWTGARWLAEICKYILWQAHVRLRKIGGKTVRERVSEPF